MTSENISANPELAAAGSTPANSLPLILSHLGVILLVGLILFWPVLRNEFVLNDIPEIANNPLISSEDYIASIFTPEGAANALEPGYYSPVTDISYAIDYNAHTDAATGILSSAGVHATTLGLYLAVCVLAYLLTLFVTRRPWLAALASAIFLIHPMHAENANYVASRGETLAALFTLGLLVVAWVRPSSLAAKTTLAVVNFFLALFAMLSAPVGLAAPLLLLIVDRIRERQKLQPAMEQWKLRYVPVVIALATWAGLNLWLFKTIFPVGMNPFAQTLSAGAKFLLPFQVAFRYLTLAVLPYPMTSVYNPLESSHALLVNGIVALALLVALGLVAAALSRRIRWLGFGALWFALAMIPIAIYSPWQQVISESRLLLPSLGICLILASLVFAAADETRSFLEGTRNTVLAVVVVTVLALFVTLDVARGRHWKTGVALWTAESAIHPNEEQVLASLGFYQAQQGQLNEAEKTFRKAFANLKTRDALYYELAFVLMTNKKEDEARDLLNKALELDNKNGDFYAQVGLHFERLRDFDKAVTAYEKGVEADPENQNVRFMYGNALMLRQRPKEATEQYSEALEGLPKSAQAPLLVNRSIARRRAGDMDGALEDANLLRQIDPFDSRAYTLASSALIGKARAMTDEEDPDKSKREKLTQDAVLTLQEGVQNIPTPSRDLLLTLAQLQFTLGFSDPAIVNARNASMAYNRDLTTQIFLGTLLLATKQFDELGLHYARVLNEIPAASKDPRILASLGYAFMQKGQNTQAASLCEQSLKIAPTNSMGLLLYKELLDRKVPVNVTLKDLPPNIIFPQGLPTIGEGEFTFDEPEELESPLGN